MAVPRDGAMGAMGAVLPLNGAVTQADRLAGAPAPDRVAVDGRSLAEILAFAGRYGTLIQFYDLSRRPDGDWSIFFTEDPSIGIALRAGLDLPGILDGLHRTLDELEAAGGAAEGWRPARDLVAAIAGLLRLLHPGRAVGNGLHALLAHVGRGPRHEELADPARRLARHLGGIAGEDGLPEEPALPSADWLRQLYRIFAEMAVALEPVLEESVAAARGTLEESLRQQDHAPQSAMWDAFAVLFGHAQDAINRFPARLADYYYRKVLRQAARGPVPDSLFLTFTTAEGIDRTSVPRSTRFPAGTDRDGKSIDYAPDRALEVYAAAIAGLRTLRRVEAPPFDGSSQQATTQLLSGTVAPAEDGGSVAAAFPPFGIATAGTCGGLASAPASLGFSVSTPTLTMEGGARTIALTLTPTAASAAALNPLLQEIAGAVGLDDPWQVAAQVVRQSFDLFYSTSGGLMPVSAYRVEPQQESGDAAASTALTLTVALTEGSPPLVALASSDTQGGDVPDGVVAVDGTMALPTDPVPFLLARLRQEAVTVAGDNGAVQVPPYALLSQLALSGLSVTVTVGGFAGLTVDTPAGTVDTGQPFGLFGPSPAKLATAAISAPELWVKTLSSLDLSLTWYGIPINDTGFQGYYKGYIVDPDGRRVPAGSLFDNASFTASLSVANPGLWSIGAVSSPYLFRTAASSTSSTSTDPTDPQPDGKLLSLTDFAATATGTVPPVDYDPSQSALCLTLTGPDYAFGDTLYAASVMESSLERTALASACSERCSREVGGRFGEVVRQTIRLQAVNTKTPDSGYAKAIADQLEQTLTAMNTLALEATGDAIDAGGGDSSQRAALRSDLSQALTATGNDSSRGAGRIFRRKEGGQDASAVAANLSAWIEANRDKFSTAAKSDLDLAGQILAAAQSLAAAAGKDGGEPSSAGRTELGAAIQEAQAAVGTMETDRLQRCTERCLNDPSLPPTPNVPWPPNLAQLTIGYTATTTLPPISTDAQPAMVYARLLPFDGISAVPPQDFADPAGVPLLFAMAELGSLLIGLNGPAATPTLLFDLSPGPDGWSSQLPPVAWAQSASGAGGLGIAESWTPLSPVFDTTEGLRDTGIVGLALDPALGAALRLSVESGPEAFPWIAGLAPNAVAAQWVGPGGAATLGTPLPAGTIAASDPALAEIATIDQPLPSTGGRPAEEGTAFQMWMAERLRHKGYAVQSWDYGRIVLAEYPSLWQVAVVPARDAAGASSPGSVWVVPVAGPTMPGTADTTEPQVPPPVLSAVGELLAAVTSPFIALHVTNPPYLRLSVTAEVVFSDADTAESWSALLESELISWLSPWPPTGLGPRPSDYYTRPAITEFVRGRPYVLGILSLAVTPEAGGRDIAGWRYLTSALHHQISGRTDRVASARRVT